MVDPSALLLAEQRALDLLDAAQLAPGSSLRVLAQRLGVQVYDVNQVHPRLRTFAVRAPAAVFLAKSESEQADQFALGHSLMRLNLPWALLDTLSDRQQRRLCNHASACLLLPRAPLCASVAAADWHLPSLLERWPLAGVEVLAGRLAQLYSGIMVAHQIGTGWLRRGALGGELHSTPALAAAAQALTDSDSCALVVDRVAVQAWRLVGSGNVLALLNPAGTPPRLRL